MTTVDAGVEGGRRRRCGRRIWSWGWRGRCSAERTHRVVETSSDFLRLFGHRVVFFDEAVVDRLELLLRSLVLPPDSAFPAVDVQLSPCSALIGDLPVQICEEVLERVDDGERFALHPMEVGFLEDPTRDPALRCIQRLTEMGFLVVLVPGEHLGYLPDELRSLAVEDQLVEGLLVLLLNRGLDGFVESLLLRSADISLVDLTKWGR